MIHLAPWLLLASPLIQDTRLEPARHLDGYFPWKAPATLTDWKRERTEVRRRVLVAAGLWPEPVELELAPPVIHGAIQRDGYTVEKVYFESLPGFHVTGNLYRPEGDGPFPTVLTPHGHWTDGRFSAISDDEAIAQIERGEEEHFANARYHLQARCASLASAGHVVFHYDMVGYADSRQIDHAAGFGDVEAELWGMSAFGLQTLNSIRALDFVLALPEVDPARVAVTGGSGGGTQTFILGAIDDRPSLLMPAVMVSTSMQGGCVCENASHLRIGTGNVELAALAAPRPLGLTGANDWTREIATKGGPALRELYGLYDAASRLEIWCYPEQPHNYNLFARQHLYQFLARHFGSEFPDSEPALLPIEPARLSVYDGAHPRPGAGIAEVRAQLLAQAQKEVSRLARLARDDRRAFHRATAGALHSMIAPRQGLESTEAFDELIAAGGPAKVRVRFEGRAGDGLALVDAMGEGESSHANAPILVRASRSAQQGLGDAWRQAGGRQVLVDSLLGDPSSQAQLPVDANRHGTYVGYTLGYNRSLLAERVGDFAAAVELTLNELRQRSEPRPVLALHGDSNSTPWVLLAAALLSQGPIRVAVEIGFDFDQVESPADPNFLPGAMRWGGMTHYAALVAPRPLLLIGCDEVPAVIRDAYAASGASEAVRAVPGIGARELAAWLAGDERE